MISFLAQKFLTVSGIMRSDSEEVRHKKTNRQKRSVCFFERSPAHQGKLEGKNTKLQQKGEGDERRETLQRRQQEGDQLKRPKEAKAGAGAAATITKHYNIMHSLFNAISV